MSESDAPSPEQQPAPARRGPGRPTKKTPEVVAAIIATLKAGVPLTIAAPASGVSRDTVQDWRRDDPEFSAACERAEAEARGSFIVRLAKQSAEGNVAATIYWLKCRCPEMREPKEQPLGLDVGRIDSQAAMSRLLMSLANKVATGEVPASVLREVSEAVGKASDVLERSELEARVRKLEESGQ